jgi:hypothetical protein
MTILQALLLGAADSDTRMIRYRPLSHQSRTRDACEPHTMSPRRERQSTQPVKNATRAVKETLKREEVKIKNIEQRLKYRRVKLREKRQLESI